MSRLVERGQVWILGEHRLMCGDSTSSADVSTLMGGDVADVVVSDPPYGMGKESEGVENDNLRKNKLDAFQMSWWRAFRPAMRVGTSVYIWGAAPDLWRLWYVGGLADSETLDMRQEVVWTKPSAPGRLSSLMGQYPTATERALFFVVGRRPLARTNSDAFPGGWQPLLDYMRGEADLAGIDARSLRDAMGLDYSMYSRWFTKSQFSIPSRARYEQLRQCWPGRFLRPYESIKSEWVSVRDFGKRGRTHYFDNSHDSMFDHWSCPSVRGAARHGHPTPKPIEICDRMIISSCPEGGIVVDPFAGSGAVLMSSEMTGRRCRSMEILPRWCEVIIDRWEAETGNKAILEDQT